MKRLILFAIMTLTFVFSVNEPPTMAQAEQPKCDPAAVIKQAAALTSTGDTTKDMEALLKLQNDISAANIACNGMTFTGKGTKVLDPFVLPKGVYRVTLDFAAEASLVTFESIAPEYCITETPLSDSTKQKIAHASEDCKMTIEVRAYKDPSVWTITFEPLQ